MVEVTFCRDGRERPSRFFALGHVEIAETSSEEYSLVCAAVSAILQAARAGLEEHARVAVDVRMERGDMDLRIPASARDDERVIAIVATAELATAQIARQFPQHVRVTRAAETG